MSWINPQRQLVWDVRLGAGKDRVQTYRYQLLVAH
jgi:hypothetical protein